MSEQVEDFGNDRDAADDQRLSESVDGKVRGDSRINETRRFLALPLEVELLSIGRVSA